MLRPSPGVTAAIALFIFALLFWWAHIQHTEAENRTITGSNSDMYMYHLPVREFGFDHLKRGDIPLWNPYTNCGMPFFATYQAALFYPLNFPHWFLRGDLAISLVYLIHIFLAGLFMYMWIRDLGGETVAAVFAGTAYMLCSFVSYLIMWPHIVLGHIWIPLIFLLLRRTFTGERWIDAALLGIAVGCQLLAGYMQGFVYTLYGVFGYLIFLILAERPRNRDDPRRLARPVALALCGLVLLPALLTAFQWIPTFQLSRLSARPPGGLTREAILIGGSLHPRTFLAVLANPGSHDWANYALYPGVLTLLLALFAFAKRGRKRELAFFSALAAIAALVAFGSNTPVFSLYSLLPTGDWFRLPNRLLILTAFSIATMAGIGCNHLIKDVLAASDFPSRIPGRYALFIALCGAFILVLPKAGGAYVFVLLACSLLAFRTKSASIAGILAVLLVGLDLMLYVSNPITFPWITRDVFPELKEEKQFLREHVGPDRVHIFRRKHSWKNFMLNANFGMIEGIRETSGYESLSLQRYAEFCAYLETGGEPSYEIPFVGWRRWSSDNKYPRMLNLLGARYIIDDVGRDLYPEDAPPRKMPKAFKRKKAFSGTLDIYENPDALPRAFYTRKIEVIKEKRDVLKKLADRSFDYRKTIILEEKPQPSFVSSGASAKGISAEIVIKPQGEDKIDLVVNVPEAGFIFLNDIFVPGWRASVDGAETKIYRADYLFMAVPVPGGKHLIEVQYRPAGFRVSAWISSLSAAIVALLLAFDFARGRTKNMAPWENAENAPETKES